MPDNYNSCNQHSGLCTTTQFLEKSVQELENKLENQRNICANVTNIQKEIEEIKADSQEYKGWIRGKFERVDTKFDEITREFAMKLDNAVREIKDTIDKKESKANNAKWVIISSIVSPIVVGVLLILANKLIK
jgi:chromosome segregation ATPase